MNYRWLEKFTIAAIYTLPMLVVFLLAANKVFPREHFYYDTQKKESGQLHVSPRNTAIVTPQTKSKRITLAMKIENDKEMADASPDIMVRKGFAAAFYPFNTSHKPREYVIRSYAGRAYLIEGNERRLIPTESMIKSYAASAKITAMSEAEYQQLELGHDLAGFMDGTLINYKDNIFVITGGRKMAIASPEVFSALGYSWDNIALASEAEMRAHPSAPAPLLPTSPHPDGTILEFSEPHSYALVDRGELIELAPEIYENYYKTVNPIKVTPQSNSSLKICSLGANGRCSVNMDDAFLNQQGESFLVTLPESSKIKSLKITFERNISFENIRRIAQELSAKL